MKQHCPALIPLLLTALFLFARAAYGADPVGFNFEDPADNDGGPAGYYQVVEGVQPTDIAGVVPQMNWNNLWQGGIGIPPGVAVGGGIFITWATPGGGAHHLNYGATPGDSLLMRGYLDTGSATTDTITVYGQTFPLYDVICYSKGDNGSETRVGKFTLSATNNGVLFTNLSKYIQDNGGSTFDGSTYIEANSTSGFPSAASGNYCRFYNVRGTNITILCTPNYGSQGNPRSPFNALQIVPIDVTPVLSNPTYASGQFHFFLNGATNSTYIILASTNLVNWFPVSTNTAPAQITNSPPAHTPYHFYRAQFQ
jgi:hypothetical protein